MIEWLDLIGTAVFAISGALAAGKNRLDLFGAIVLACVTAVGGGTLRDLVLGLTPVFWVGQTHYLIIAVVSTLLAYVYMHKYPLPLRALSYADAVGLSVFTVIGFEKGLAVSGSLLIAVLVAVMTAVAGGVMRDVLSGQVPLIFREELYAVTSLCGALVLAGAYLADLSGAWVIALSCAVTLVFRLAAIHMTISLPRMNYRT